MFPAVTVMVVVADHHHQAVFIVVNAVLMGIVILLYVCMAFIVRRAVAKKVADTRNLRLFLEVINIVKNGVG